MWTGRLFLISGSIAPLCQLSASRKTQILNCSIVIFFSATVTHGQMKSVPWFRSCLSQKSGQFRGHRAIKHSPLRSNHCLQQRFAMGRTLGMHLASRLAEVGVKVRAAPSEGKIRQAESSEHPAPSFVISCIWQLISACCPAGLVYSPG